MGGDHHTIDHPQAPCYTTNVSHIVLIRPASVFSAKSFCSAATMPLSLAYLAAALLEKGHRVDVIDALGEALEHIAVSYTPNVRYRGLSHARIVARLEGLPRPDAIGVTAMHSQEWPHHEDMVNTIAARFPGIPIILGGEHATATAEYLLASVPAVTHVALGEGEETIVEYAEFLDGRRKIGDVAGVWSRDASGAVVRNPPRARLRAPDQLPPPAWHLFDPEPYHRIGGGCGVERGRSMPIVATRGCPYQCTFCSNQVMWTTRYVLRDPVKVVDEIESHIRTYKADNIEFWDLTAIVKKSWTLAFCREVVRRGLKFTWQLPSGTRSEALDDETVKAMFDSGCRNITYAPESGSAATLDRIKKRVNLPNMIESMRTAKRLGISVKCNLIIGFPHETRRDMWRTIRLAIRLAFIGVDDAGLAPFGPYPGSELFDYLRANGAIAKLDRDYFEGLMVFGDLWNHTNYCENVGTAEITFYRLFLQCAFYGLSFLLHPSRIVRFVRNYFARRSESFFELRLFEVIRRLEIEKKSREARVARAVPAGGASSS